MGERAEIKKRDRSEVLYLMKSFLSEYRTWQDVGDADTSHQSIYWGIHSGTKKHLIKIILSKQQGFKALNYVQWGLQSKIDLGELGLSLPAWPDCY